MNRKQFNQILVRYLNGKATDTEKGLVDQWYQLLDDGNLLELQHELEIEAIGNRLWDKINEKIPIINLVSHPLPLTNKKTVRLGWLKIVAAACFIGILIFEGAYWLTSTSRNNNAYVQHLKKGMYEKINDTKKPLKINFEDGSIAVLQPDAKISYPLHFLANRREVYMDGEVFFDISKNPVRPFYVYHNNIVTHVLGTSFTVKSIGNKNEVEISVVTGRVEVYENKEMPQSYSDQSSNGVVLTPNQKVIYHEKSRQFIETLVEKPLPVITENLSKTVKQVSFVFDETPLLVVLQSIEKVYGIEIVVENETLYNCPFTGDLSQQNLYTKLDMINEVLKTSYEVKGTRILIKGKGCD